MRSTSCNPGNITIGTTTYAIPAGGVTAANASALVAGTLNHCDYYQLADANLLQERRSFGYDDLQSGHHQLDPLRRGRLRFAQALQAGGGADRAVGRRAFDQRLLRGAFGRDRAALHRGHRHALRHPGHLALRERALQQHQRRGHVRSRSTAIRRCSRRSPASASICPRSGRRTCTTPTASTRTSTTTAPTSASNAVNQNLAAGQLQPRHRAERLRRHELRPR